MPARRRAKGTGRLIWDAKRQNYRIRALNPHTGQLVERSHKAWTRGQRKAAQDALEALRAQLARPPLPPPTPPSPSITTAEYLTRWLRDKAVQVRPRTLTSYRNALALWQEAIGDIPLNRLTARDIQAAITQLVSPGTEGGAAYARSTISNARSILCGALEDAVGDAIDPGLIPANPARRTKPPRVEPREPPAMTLEEAEAILISVAGTQLAAPVALALFYGLRANEVCGLRWEHVDEAQVRVTGQLADDRRGLAPTKNPRSTRVLPMVPPVTVALATAREVLARQRRQAGDAWQESGHVLAQDNGRPMHRTRLYQLWVRHRGTRTGEPGHRTFHDLRHGTVTLLMELGVPERVAMEIVGHAAVAVHRRYAHVAPRAFEEALGRLSRALGGA